MRINRFIIFVVGFGLARATLLFAPIVLANLLTLANYGRLELAHSYAASAAVLFGLGLPSSVPLVLLRKEVVARWDTLLLACIAISVASLLLATTAFAMTGWLFTLSVLVPLLISILVLQQLWSTTLKSNGASTQSVFVEAGLWVAALCGAVFVALFEAPDALVSLSLLVYCVGLLALAIRRYAGCRAPFGTADLLTNIRLGAPLMATMALSVSITSAGRFILGSVTDVVTVGLYAVLYRSTMLPLIGHQILMIGFFRQLFTWDHEVLQRRIAVIPAVVAFSALAFGLLAHRFGFMLGTRFVEAYAAYRIEGIVILGQTTLWSAVAINDLLVTRLHLAGHVARRMFFVLLVSLPGLTFLTQSAAPSEVLRTFVVGYSAVIFVYYIVQCAVIARRGQRFTLLWCMAAAGFVVSTGLLLAFEWSYT